MGRVSMKDIITIALAKGRLAEQTIILLEKCGIECAELKKSTRKLVFSDSSGQFRFILVKPSDVPTYVEYGVADVGIAGKDTLMEANSPLYEMLDLGFGKCKLCIAGFPEGAGGSITAANKRVATKYPNIARNFYAARDETIEIIKLNGSVELGPLVGLSDVILDIVESGKTLKANGLIVLEEICDISARLVVNRVSLKTKGAGIKNLIQNMKKLLEEYKND
jgi:ATP phosphoribosyltransferase